MTEATPHSRKVRLVVLVVVASVLVALALWAGDRYASVWLTTGAAALISITLATIVDGPRLLPLLRPTRRSVFVGVLLGLLMAAGTYALYGMAAYAVPSLHDEVGDLYRALRDPPGAAFALPLLLVIIFSEELVWRGALFDAFPTRLPSQRVVVLSAALYALPHVGKGSPVLVAVAFVCGVFWGAERVWTRGLVAPLVTHVVWDLLLFVIAPLR